MGRDMQRTGLRSRKSFMAASLLGISTMILLFQNCGKKSSGSESSEQFASNSGRYTALNAMETLKLLSDGSQTILLIRQAAFNGTYPNQNPGYTPTTALEEATFDACVIATTPEGSALQSRTGKSCPFSLNFSTTSLGNNFHFTVNDASLVPSTPIYQGECSSSGTQTLMPLSRSISKVNLTCRFSTNSGALLLTSSMQSTWDLNGASRLEDLTAIVLEGNSNTYSLLSDSLAVPAIPLEYTINDVGPTAIPAETKYPTASIWPLFTF